MSHDYFEFLINKKIIFDKENRILMLDDHQYSIVLSKPASRLLDMLVSHNKINLLRGELIKSVWEDYGLSSSNASLNNHISELRKAFENLGENKNIIITIPKIGFRIDADIQSITKLSPELIRITAQTHDEHNVQETIAYNKFKVGILQLKSLIMSNINKVITSVIFIFIIAISFVLFFYTKNDDNFTFLSSLKKCDIYSIDDRALSSDSLKTMNEIIKTESIDCSHESFDIFYREDRPENFNLKINFLAACKKNNKLGYEYCNNYKTLN